MSIILKDKIKVDKTFINDLIAKSWQDNESLQAQIDSIEIDSDNAAKVVKLLKGLLTSYYTFIGCLESLADDPAVTFKLEPTVNIPEEPEAIPKEPISTLEPETFSELDLENTSEPFEYFVDFDEPTGEPLTDDDLYN